MTSYWALVKFILNSKFNVSQNLTVMVGMEFQINTILQTQQLFVNYGLRDTNALKLVT